MLLPALTVDGEGATLKVGIPSAKDGNEKIGAKNNPAIIKAILIRCMFFSFFLNHNQALLTDRTCGDLLGHYRKIKNVYHPIPVNIRVRIKPWLTQFLAKRGFDSVKINAVHDPIAIHIP